MNECTFHTKQELALEIVAHARQNGLRFGWVGADGGYGKGPGFCLGLDRIGERFVVDLHSDFRVFLEDPKPYIPMKTSRQRRWFSRHRSAVKGFEVKEIVSRLAICDQPILQVRNTSRGLLKVRALGLPVNSWEEATGQVHRYFLLATQTVGRNPKTKISLSRTAEAIELEALAWMQLQRYWVERAF